jgi:hypothetical protein
MKPRLLLPLAVVALGAAVAPGCADSFQRIGPGASLVVNITSGQLGSRSAPLPIPLPNATPYTVDVEAHKADGSLDTSFNGFVRASVKPGTVGTVTGANTDGRNVQLVNGVAHNVTVNVAAAYGDARIWFEDIGYTPASILRQPPPQCSDGLDNNGNGVIDFPADPGCAFANDDSEDGGTLATGVSQAIYFLQPRIADVRGRTVVMGSPVGGNVTNFPHEQVQIDTGWRPASTDDPFAFSTIVTRIAADGFYATDLQDDISQDPASVPGYGSVFAFTFSTPPLMRVCDRLKLFGGTASDFHGFTEVGFPTWLLEEWDPTLRPCAVPPAPSLSPTDIVNSDLLFKLESSLVRIESRSNWTVHVASHFGPAPVAPQMDGSYVFTADASNCDFNHNGKVDFDGGQENVCSCYCNGCSSDPRQPNASPPVAIGADAECSEYSQFAGQNELVLVVVYKFDPMSAPTLTKLQIDGSSSAAFDPLTLKGQQVRSFTGTLRYFSGGSQFTVEARCDDDIILDPNVVPFCSDADYDNQVPNCGTLDGKPPTTLPVPFVNRRLACVHARSIPDQTP